MIGFSNGKIVVGLRIGCTVEDAWRVLTDTQQWPRWGPSVRQVASGQRFIGPTSTGRIKTMLGFWLPFMITEYQDQQFWSWRVGRIQATGHRVSHEDGACLVAFEMPWWATPYVIVCWVALRRIRRLLSTGEHPS